MLKLCFRNDDLSRNTVFDRLLHNPRTFVTMNNIVQLQLPNNVLPASVIQVAESK